MENNIYVINKMEVKKISDEQGVDLSVACAILRDREGWFKDAKDPDSTAFVQHINGLTPAEFAAFFAD